MKIESKPYGLLPDGRTVTLFTLTNRSGMRIRIIDYGGIIVSLEVPDRHSESGHTDLVLGKDDLQGYLNGHPHFGCITGRVAGRISGGQFTLEGKKYTLETNNGPNTLHGGTEALHQVLWDASILNRDGIEKLRLSTLDPDGSNGFPGNLQCTVSYALLEDNTLEIIYTSSCDQSTPLNLTNHSYFNLAGESSGDVFGHKVQILSDAIAPVDENSTLIGKRETVRTGFNDYREPITLNEYRPLVVANADIHYFLEDGRSTSPRLIASVEEPRSGRILEVLTTEPGVQFYAGLSLENELGKNGHYYGPSAGFCLETQDYPDSVNYPELGQALLSAEEVRQSTTLYRFSGLG